MGCGGEKSEGICIGIKEEKWATPKWLKVLATLKFVKEKGQFYKSRELYNLYV